MLNIIHQAERIIVLTLIGLMTLMLLVATLNLGYTVFLSFLESPTYLITPRGLMQIFDSFLVVLIGLELLETIRTFLKDNVVHVEVVMLVAIIAIARKVIVLDYDKYSGLEFIGIGLLIIALAVGYFFIRRAIHQYCETKTPSIHTPQTHNHE
ncbi:MAG: phosphate-starvation-inducible PsiE family protein [Bacteroidales bacterium]|nr:phosphate-starvation-inducible PsiE family protein [Bacteroidales bacterium]